MEYKIKAPLLGEYDVAVCGGGIAGVMAAITAAREGAKVVLIESLGYLGGTLTGSNMPSVLDSDNKGGLIREMLDFLTQKGMTCIRRGKRTDENGKKYPGNMVDIEGCKYFFDMTCKKEGVTVLYYSMVSAAEKENEEIKSLLISSICGNYAIRAKVYIDATGNGTLAGMCGCEWEIGEPDTGDVQPASVGLFVGGYQPDFDSFDSQAEKVAHAKKLAEHGIHLSSGSFSLVKLPNLVTWSAGCNFEYGVYPDNIKKVSEATTNGRMECFEVVEKYAAIPGYENMHVSVSSELLGIREGRRIMGEYRICEDDLIEGRRFEDGVCLVTAKVDVHRLHKNDTDDCQRGHLSKPYHIPYRALLPIGLSNTILAGRCISGNFYPQASYRMIGNMGTVGEAAGYAAALAAKENISPKEVDGKKVSAFMKSRGHVL